MLRCRFNKTLAESLRCRLLRSHQPMNMQQQFVRYARTKSNKLQTSQPLQPELNQQIVTKPLSESQVSSQNKQRVEINRDELLLEQLNIARPGTATDHRYKQQAKIMSTLRTEEERIQSLFVFLTQEAFLELEQYPNPDEISSVDDIHEGVTLEQQMEYEMKKSLSNQWNTVTERYKRFEILLTVLEKLHAKSNGGYLVPVEVLVSLFDASKYIVDAEKLQAQIRYLCGDLIYSLKKFEFDIINESFYVEALMRFGFHKRANGILLKRQEKLSATVGQSQRWWGDLIIINHIDMNNLVAAEACVKELSKNFGTEYLDSRVYSAFVKVYIEADNFERVSSWVEKLNQSIVKTEGFALDEAKEEPGLESDEETVLSYLNREDPITKSQYLEILELILESDKDRYQALVAKMIDFYLTQPHTSLQEHSELVELLLKFRFEYNNKIKPILQAVPSKHNLTSTLIPLLEQLRSMNPVETAQTDLLDDYFTSLSNTSGGFVKITKEMKNVMKSKDGKLTPKNYYALISALIKARKIDEAYQVLGQLEDPQNDLCSVSTNHYVPFLRHYGRTSQMDKFYAVLKRFKEHNNKYNPVILTQMLNSLTKNKQYDEMLKIVGLIALNDIHLQDPEYSDKPLTILYSSIWASLLSYLKSVPYHEVKGLPDLRYIFIKMTQESHVIPNREDYETIVITFLKARDFYSVVCVLDVMGSKHKVIPSFKVLNQVESIVGKIEGMASKFAREKEYSKKFDELRHERAAMNSLDPFAKPDQKNKDNDKDLMEDYLDPELELTTTQENLYKLPILKLFDTLSKTYGFDDAYMKQVWREFGLEGAFDLAVLRDGLKEMEKKKKK
ncbi:hypothetical protein WICPIJ_010087 [Wickerhamomyces pijperi]|uniref:Mitochondrial group I intron splicing factor CCM1 n=1 Tax=Wickerhamomyces pijperi TaxID=599730 RepID=A0A9P8PIQ2_WICPI|nr:hypothetical protein WICPIJ_010087 [Wickerhamomyces pijperi]